MIYSDKLIQTYNNILSPVLNQLIDTKLFFEHLCLVTLDDGAIWAPPECVRLEGEGSSSSVRVSNAGCSLVNGTYASDGQFNGKDMFTSPESGLQLWFNGQWRIGRTNDYYYVCNDEEPVGGAWEVATFQANTTAAEPAPAPLTPAGPPARERGGANTTKTERVFSS